MTLSKREFLQVLSAASVAGMGLARYADADAATAEAGLYDLPPLGTGAGHVSFLHMTDCHAQLKPIYFREPSVNLGLGSMQGQLPHLVGEHLLKKAGVRPGTALAHAYTFIDFERAAERYGKVGGFAHLATLVKRLKASRPGALLLDGGDTWQGSATALWTNGQDMVDACKALTVDVMTGHWEFTLGMERVKEIVEKDFAGKVDFVAQNVKTTDFGDPVFKPYVMREMNGVKVAIVGQAFPYTPIANPRYMVADWSFGIQDENMQKVVDEARGKGAQLVVRAQPQRHGRRPEDGQPRARRRRHLRRPHARRRAAGGAGEERRRHHAGHQRRQQRQVPGRDGLRGQGRQGGQLALPAAAGVQRHAQGRPRDGRADHQGPRPLRGQAGREAGRHRRPAVPPRQFQRQLGPAAVRRHDGRAGRRYRLLARLPLGHQPAAGRRDHARADDGPGGHHLQLRHRHRDVGRDDQDGAGRRVRQPVQSRPLLPAGRRHGAHRRPHLHLRTGRGHGQAHPGHAAEGQADRGEQDLQGRRLGAGGRRGARAPATR